MYVLWQQRLRCLYANLRVVRITFSNATTRTQAHTSTSRGEQIICVWYYQTCIRSPFVQCIRNHMLSGYIQLIQREREETVKGGGVNEKNSFAYEIIILVDRMGYFRLKSYANNIICVWLLNEIAPMANYLLLYLMVSNENFIWFSQLFWCAQNFHYVI